MPSNGWGKAEILKQIAKVKVRPVDEFALHQVTRLDPDLAFTKSLSMSARIRLQAQRNVVRAANADKAYWLRQLEQWVGD